MVHSLRDFGYDFPHAVADIVDNSISAGATRVEIDVRFDGSDSWVRIADDGAGMSSATINEAMRYGADRGYESNDLGKFGLGLKTASTSQCRRVTVASRSDPRGRRIHARQLDLDHVEEVDRWEVFDLPAAARDDRLTAPLREHTGTVVMWEELDRVLSYKVPWGERARAGLLAVAERLDEHLGVVFHRFLTGEAARKRKLAITINGTKVEPWDPFCRDEASTKTLTSREFVVQGQDGPGIVRFSPFVLPAKDRFSNNSAWMRAGLRNWNSQQGFYIYRADRMIQSGGWSRTRTPDEHTKLARVALDFYPDLDDAFGINVAKMRVTLPSDLREELARPVEQAVKVAKASYSGDRARSATPRSATRPTPGPSPTSGGGEPPSHPSPPSSSATAPATSTTPSAGGPASPAGPSPAGVRDALEAAAQQAGESGALARIIKIVREQTPEVARELGW